MKTIRLIFATLFIIAMGNSYTSAQPGGPWCKGPCNSQQLDKALNLSIEQQKQLDDLNDSHIAKMRALQEDESLTVQDRREKMMEEHDAYRDQIKIILTEEQFKKFVETCPPKPFWSNKGVKRNYGRGHGFMENEEVQNLILQERAKFENELSNDERAVIATVREAVAQHRQMVQELEPGDMTPAERREMHDEHMKRIEPLYEIAENHKESLDVIHEEIKGDFRQNCPKKGDGFRHRRDANGRGYGYGMHGDVKGIYFLLLDPKSNYAKFFDSEDDGLKVFPNPFTDEATIEFNLDESASVKIELLDKNGNQVRELARIQGMAGNNAFQFDGNGLDSSELYFIKVTASDRSMIEKIIKR
ncbi:MAG: T9SS type A sorting domain-containing protein [Bacteroidales bacterium]|nr:T9SS type A sorting domain-containing protein [Bacteroidales bacterium]